MAYRGAVEEQIWSKEEMAAYCKKFDEKRPAYLRKAEQTVRGSGSQRKNANVVANTRSTLSKAQYIRFQEKDVSDDHVVSRYPDLTMDQLQQKKKRWGLA